MSAIKQNSYYKYPLFLALLLFAISHVSAPLFAGNNKKTEPNWVSIINLVAAPEKFDSELIFVSGWLYIGLENNSLCLMKNPPSSKECLWLNFTDSPSDSYFGSLSIEQRQQLLLKHKGQIVSIHGTFDSSDTGHMGGWSGGIHKITDIFFDQH